MRVLLILQLAKLFISDDYEGLQRAFENKGQENVKTRLQIMFKVIITPQLRKDQLDQNLFVSHGSSLVLRTYYALGLVLFVQLFLVVCTLFLVTVEIFYLFGFGYR